MLTSPPSRCFRCHKSTRQSQTCQACRKATGLDHVWIAAEYDGVAKETIELLKFERAAAASKDIARCIAAALPLVSEDTIICFVPTTPKRIRVRGYDQARLIAIELAKQLNCRFKPLIKRKIDSRQVGASRSERFLQAKSAYGLNIGELSKKTSRVLIIDDVTTSGATLEAVAQLAKKARIKHVDAAVFAQAVD